MKKSAIYYLAQRAVVTDESIAVDVRLEILRELMAKESIEKLMENQQEKEAQEVENNA